MSNLRVDELESLTTGRAILVDDIAFTVARGVVAVDSIADLLALPEEQRNGDLRYLVKGYHAGSDVGGGEFYWVEVGAQTPDTGTILNVPGLAVGRWVRVLPDHVTPEMFGAVGDGVVDDSDAIQAAIGVSTGRDRVVLSREYKLGKTILIDRAPINIDFSSSRIYVSDTFVGAEVFRLGFRSGWLYLLDSRFSNLYIEFLSTELDIDVFNTKDIARVVFEDIIVHNLVGTVFTETSVGHEITVRNLTARSAPVENGAGFWVNFTDSYFEDIKPIGFSEYGIVNDGADNRFYGCHPWSYPRGNAEYDHFTTKILFWDREDGMWTDCFADTFQREDPDLPPSFDNGGVAYHFSKVSGIGRMVNCGFYALDTSPGSVIGISTDAGPQQVNCVNGYVLGTNSAAYLKYVSVPNAGTAINLIGCNFSETQFQAKELVSGSAIVSNTEFYIKNIDASAFNTLQANLRSWKPRRNSHGLITFRDDGVSSRVFAWDQHTNNLEELVKLKDTTRVIHRWESLGITDANAPTTKAGFFAQVASELTARGYYPCKIVVDCSPGVYPNIVSNIMPGSGILTAEALASNRISLEFKYFSVASVPKYAAYESYNNTFHGWV